MIDIDQIMIQFPDIDRDELVEWISSHPSVSYEEIINDINEGLFENMSFYEDLYKIWKSNNNGQGLTNQQNLLIFKFHDIMLEWQQIDLDKQLFNDLDSGAVKWSEIVWSDV